MKKNFVWCAVVLVALVGMAQAKDKMAGGTEQAVTALEQQWVSAMKAGNPDMIAANLADQFVDTGTDGKVVGKSEVLKSIKGAKWTTNEIGDVKVMVYGNTAIATGTWTGKGTDGSGQPVDTHERWTDTWIKMSGGKWQCVASQNTSVKM